MDNILFYSICIIPGLIILWYIYIKDKIEKEPIYLLTILFVGGIIACDISVLLEILLKNNISFLTINSKDLNFFEIVFKYLISIAIIEELSKWIISYITIWKNKNFKHLYDPIVYCTFVAIGFATLENIIYGFSYIANGLTPLILRGIISVPCHAIFGIYMGYYLGISKNSLNYNKKKQSNKYKILSIISPIILHYIYDILLIKENIYLSMIFIIYLIIIYIQAFLMIKKMSSINKNMITK